MKFFNKRGLDVGMETVIFIVLNLFFFLSLLYFVSNSANGAFIYEQAYAKEIALLIDNAKPDSTIYVSLDNIIPVAAKNSVKPSEIIRIDSANKRVIVSLTGKRGYSMQYFSDYNVNIVSDNIARIYVKEKSSGGTA